MAKKKSKVLQTDTPPMGESAPSEENATALKDFREWERRIKRAARSRTEWEKDYDVEECEYFFIGKQGGKGRRIDQATVLNHFQATIKTIRPNLLFQSPKFVVRPKPGQENPAEEMKAHTAEGVLESIGTQSQCLKNAAKLGTLQSFWRVGVIKCVYDPTLIANPDAGKPIYQTDAEGAEIKGPDGAAIPMKDPLTGETMTEPAKILRDDVYRYEWVDARNMLFPDEGPDLTKWTWIGEEVMVPLAEAKEDERFPEDLRRQFTANATYLKDSYERRTSSKPTEEEEPMFRYLEVYDLKGQRQLMWADGQDYTETFLVDRPLPAGIERHPYAILPGYTPILGPKPSAWPYPYTRDWITPQRDYNISRQQVIEGSKRSARKFIYDDNTFPSETEAAKLLQNPQDMVGAKVNDVTRPPVILATPDINAAIYKNIPLQFNDWRILSGQTGARMADPENSSATEAAFVEKQANIRDQDMIDVVNDWLSEAGRKMLQLIKGTLTLGLWVKIRGLSDEDFLGYVERHYGIPQALFLQNPQLKQLFIEKYGGEQWQYVTREQLDFEADVTVVPGSARPKNMASEQKLLMEAIQLIMQFPVITKVPILLRRFLRAFDFEEPGLMAELQAAGDLMIQLMMGQAGRGTPQDQNGAKASTAGNPDMPAQSGGIQARLMSLAAGAGGN